MVDLVPPREHQERWNARALTASHLHTLTLLCSLRARSWVRSEGYTYCKAQTSEQFGNMEADVLEIPNIGDITYTPEYMEHKAFLTTKEKPELIVEARAGIYARKCDPALTARALV